MDPTTLEVLKWGGGAVAGAFVAIGGREGIIRLFRVVRPKRSTEDVPTVTALLQQIADLNDARLDDAKTSHEQTVNLIRQIQPVLSEVASLGEAHTEMAAELRSALNNFGTKLEETVVRLERGIGRLERVSQARKGRPP